MLTIFRIDFSIAIDLLVSIQFAESLAYLMCQIACSKRVGACVSTPISPESPCTNIPKHLFPKPYILVPKSL